MALKPCLNEFKQNYIFYALLQLTKKHFHQAQFIKDYFERNKYLDTRGMIYKPMYGYSKYDNKLNDPIKSYVKDNR